MASGISVEEKSKTLTLLCETFQNVDRNLIQTVAEHCNFDIDQAGNVLSEMFYPQQNTSVQNKEQYDASRATQNYGYTEDSNDKLNQIVDFIKSGYKIMILMRGLPGSGKTTLARMLVKNGLGKVNEDEFIFSADGYFYQTGKYIYNPKEIDDAHKWNQKRSYGSMKRGVSPIIIDNTNLNLWEMKVYCIIAVEFGYMIEIIDPITPWASNVKTLAKKNTHGVENKKIKDMATRYMQNITPAMLYKEFELTYKCKMPQYRLYPKLPESKWESWKPPSRQYATPPPAPPRKSQLPNEYVHKFEMKYDDSSLPIPSASKTPAVEYVHKFEMKYDDFAPPIDSKTEKPVDVDQMLNIDKEAKYADTKTEDLISFINEHKQQPQNEEPINSAQMNQLSKQLDENKRMMLKMMELIEGQKMSFRNTQRDLSEDKITSTMIETRMEVDQISTQDFERRSFTQQDVPNYTGDSAASKNLEDLSKENRALWNLMHQSETADSLSKKKQLDLQANNPFFSEESKVVYSATEKQKLQTERMKRFLAEKTSPDDFEIVDFGLSNTGTRTPTHNRRSSLPKFDRKAWGLAEDALVSWEITSPPPYHTLIPEVVPVTVETTEKGTSTSEDDFKSSSMAEGLKRITPRKTPINSGTKFDSFVPRKRITLDKGCMTDEDDLLMKMIPEEGDQIKHLTELFPQIPIESILDVYEKCAKDVCWTAELISNSPNSFMSSNSLPDKSDPKKESSTTSFKFDLNDWNITPVSSTKQQETKQETPPPKTPEEIEEDEAAQQKRQEELHQLKKQLEKSVTIAQEHYSDRVWQIKSAKNKTPPNGTTRKSGSFEMMNVDDDAVYVSDDTTDSASDGEDAAEDLVEMNLGTDMVNQLEAMFGHLMFGANFKPVVQMPESMARQLHALYLESVCRQIEHQSEYITSQVREDEEYAMKLQEEERKSTPGTTMNEIMGEELAMSIHKKNMDQWKDLTPETLALKLTRQKLYEAFPNINKKILDEILVAHGNNYQQTIESVMNSTEELSPASKENLMQPPISDNTLKELKTQELYFNKVTDAEDDDRTAISYRDEANQLMERRRELLDRVREHQQKRNFEVALYYRSLAEKAAKRAEYANQQATQRFINENTKKFDNGDTLDLHFLFVKGAIAALDIFIDFQISNLKAANKPHQYYYVITGRGNRSENGKSKLRPAVMKRLKKRNVGYTQINPGMLKIKIFKNLPSTSDLAKSS